MNRPESQNPLLLERSSHSLRRQAAAYFFRQNFAANCVLAWENQQPDQLSEALSGTSYLTDKDVENWRNTLSGGNIYYDRVSTSVRKLSGITFEYLTRAYLETTKQFRKERFVPIDFNLFDDVICALSVNSQIEAEQEQKPDGFKRTKISWRDKRLVIPDGLVLRSDGVKSQVSGVFETTMVLDHNNSFSRALNFLKFLRQNPTTAGLVLGILELENYSVADESQTQSTVFIRSNNRTKEEKDYKNPQLRAEVVPFNYPQTAFQTLRILKHLNALQEAVASR